MIHRTLASACFEAWINWPLLLSAMVVAAPCAADAGGAAQSASLAITSPPLDDCPERPVLERAVERRIGRSVFAPQPELRFELGFERDASGSGYRARIVLYDEQGRLRGERVLSSDRAACRELEASVVLVLALLVESPPEPVAATVPATAASPPPPEPRTEAGERASAKEPPRSEAGAPRYRFDAGVAGVVGTPFGTWAPGVRAALGIEPSWAFLVRAELTRWGTTDAELDGSAAGARMRATSLGVELCPLRRWGALGAWLCAGERTDFFEAEGFGFSEDATERATAVHLLARAGGSIRLVGPLHARMSLGATLGLLRPELRYAADGENRTLHAVPLLAGELDLGLGLELTSSGPSAAGGAPR